MKLKTLKLINFKGTRNLEINFSSDRTSIHGDNGTGKTTISDALRWLLFGKDSEGRAAFGIKTIGAESEYHTVEAGFIESGRAIILSRTFSEIWTQKRGSATTEFTGHQTEFSIGGVPKKKKEFDDFVREHFGTESEYMMLTDPLYFGAVMDWKARRDILTSLADTASDEDLIESRIDEFHLIPSILAGRNIDDTKAVLNRDRKAINEQLKSIPIRIDELKRTVKEHRSEYDINRDIEDAAELEKKKLMEIDRLKSGDKSVDSKRLADLENQANLVRVEHEHQKTDALKELGKLNENKLRERREFSAVLFDNKRDAEASKKEIKSATNLKKDLLKQWQETSSLKFESTGICSTCGQSLPGDLLQKEREIFNRKRSEKLGEIQDKAEHLNLAIEAEKIRLSVAERNISEAQTKLEFVENYLNSQKFEFPEFVPDSSVSDEIAALKAKLAEVGPVDDSALKTELEAIRKNRAAFETELASVGASRETARRIIELEDGRKKFGREFEEIDHRLFILEQFVKARCEAVESSVNGMFELVKFRMFREQINGGLEPCCDVLGPGGVQFDNDLNHGMRINCGLDIIRVIQDREFPIVIDNAESVTSLIEMPNQMIRLVVDPSCKNLEVKSGN